MPIEYVAELVVREIREWGYMEQRRGGDYVQDTIN